MRYMIVDDEPIAHRIIEGYAGNLSFLEKAGNCYDAFEAIEFLQKEKVDLLFLDINMPKLSGLDFLKSLQNPPIVIITSAYQEYALQGFELAVCDYLLKPFALDRFLKAVNKAQALFNQETPASTQSIFIKGDKKIHQVIFSSILAIEAAGNYCKIITREGTITTHQKISDFEQTLPSSRFLRVHKSFIISIDKIGSIEGNQIRINSLVIPVGPTFKQDVAALY